MIELSPVMAISTDPSLYTQYIKGLLLGGLLGWFISSYLYYRQYNNLIKYLQEVEDE